MKEEEKCFCLKHLHHNEMFQNFHTVNKKHIQVELNDIHENMIDVKHVKIFLSLSMQNSLCFQNINVKM